MTKEIARQIPINPFDQAAASLAQEGLSATVLCGYVRQLDEHGNPILTAANRYEGFQVYDSEGLPLTSIVYTDGVFRGPIDPEQNMPLSERQAGAVGSLMLATETLYAHGNRKDAIIRTHLTSVLPRPLFIRDQPTRSHRPTRTGPQALRRAAQPPASLFIRPWYHPTSSDGLGTPSTTDQL